MITSSGNRYATLVRLDERNILADVWWCEGKQKWHWRLVWGDGDLWGSHMHSGTAPTKSGARADIVKTMIWIEDTFPKAEYWEGA